MSMIGMALAARDGFSLAKPFGPVYWGFMMNLTMFGMSILQALWYFREAGKDRVLVKLSALGMIIMDIASTSLIISVIWSDLILHYGGLEQYAHTNPQIGAECYISMCIAFLAQIYFMNQIYYVKPAGIWGNLILGTIAVLAFAGWAFGLGCATVMLLDPTTPHYNWKLQIVFGGSKGANAVCDILATIMMCKYLKDSKTGVQSTSNLLDALTKLFMNRGGAVMVIQVFTFVMFWAFENPQYWLAPHLLLTKLYVNTFFAILNSRSYLRQKYMGTNVSGSTQVSNGAEKGYASASAPMTFAPNNVHSVVSISKDTTVKTDDAESFTSV